MNDLQTLPRGLEATLAAALRTFPVVVVTGARQTGKSTLVRSLAPAGTRRYVTLDDLETLARAQREPDALLASSPRLTVDEVQRTPELLLAIKRAVDERRVPGRFLLTGSSNLLLMRRVSESLAGRAIHLTLMPLTQGELRGEGRFGRWAELFAVSPTKWKGILEESERPPANWREAVLLGGYPVPAHVLPSADARSLWHAGYVQTYLERDLRDLSEVASLVDFRRLMSACCLRTGNLVNQTELGRDVGLSQPTVHRHLDLLETSHQLVRVPAFAANRTKRLIKTPKLYWTDTALALHLAVEQVPRGAHLENLVLADLLAWRGATPEAPQITHWRNASGHEIDFVVEWRGRLLPIEVKTSVRAHVRDAATIQEFRASHPNTALPGLLLHAGPEVAWIADGVLAAPWWRVL